MNESWAEVEKALKEPFSPNALHWRKGRGNSMLAYLNARDVMKRLDDVVGMGNWQDKYEEVSGRLICHLSVRVGDDWITKCDGAGDTNIESEKGGISDAFKRAGARFGIGRYIYYFGQFNVTQNNIPPMFLPYPKGDK
jgi:hypothetical protein